jgi:hypothetical protein
MMSNLYGLAPSFARSKGAHDAPVKTRSISAIPSERPAVESREVAAAGPIAGESEDCSAARSGSWSSDCRWDSGNDELSAQKKLSSSPWYDTLFRSPWSVEPFTRTLVPAGSTERIRDEVGGIPYRRLASLRASISPGLANTDGEVAAKKARDGSNSSRANGAPGQ